MTLVDSFNDIFYQCQPAFKQTRTWSRAKDLAHGILSCMGRSTITGWLVSSGLQFKDWSSSYKLFANNRIDNDAIFSVLRQEVVSMNKSEEEYIYAHMDDTLLRKTGKKVSGAKWMRDPLSPPFHTNFVWGQRFLQISLSLFKEKGAVPSKSIPIDMVHCPLPLKPKKEDTAEKYLEYKEQQKKTKLSQIGCDRVNILRENLNQDGHTNKTLVVCVDGSYTNQTVLKNLKTNTVLIGRVRKDAKLSTIPNVNLIGRRRIYGEDLPTPEKIRQSDLYQWQHVEAWATGQIHKFKVKVVKEVRWRKSSDTNLQLVIIQPLGYRLTKTSKILYRDPTYLICTDSELDIEKLIQAYLRRWGLEVNFREEKTTLGCGKAQVRNKESCQNVPAFHTAIYSMLLIASEKNKYEELPRPKWYKKENKSLPTTGDLINLFKATNWANYMAISYKDFINLENKQRSPKNSSNPNLSAILYSRN